MKLKKFKIPGITTPQAKTDFLRLSVCLIGVWLISLVFIPFSWRVVAVLFGLLFLAYGLSIDDHKPKSIHPRTRSRDQGIRRS